MRLNILFDLKASGSKLNLAVSDDITGDERTLRMNKMKMHLPLISFAILVTAGFCGAQEFDYRFIIDAPGPGYRQMSGEVDDRRRIILVAPKPVLSFQPNELSTATLVPLDVDQSQIRLTFRPESVKRIREYIEFNKTRGIRVEIGDYTLLLDMEKTLPWTTGVWLQTRATEKAKIIFQTLQKPE